MDEWKECQRDVYHRLGSIEKKIDVLIESDGDRRERLAKVEMKASFWGFIGGAIASIAQTLFGHK